MDQVSQSREEIVLRKVKCDKLHLSLLSLIIRILKVHFTNDAILQAVNSGAVTRCDNSKERRISLKSKAIRGIKT